MSQQGLLTVEALRDELNNFMKGAWDQALSNASQRIADEVKAELCKEDSMLLLPILTPTPGNKAPLTTEVHDCGSASVSRSHSRPVFGPTTTIKTDCTYCDESSPMRNSQSSSPFGGVPTLKQDFLASHKEALGPWACRPIRINTRKSGHRVRLSKKFEGCDRRESERRNSTKEDVLDGDVLAGSRHETWWDERESKGSTQVAGEGSDVVQTITGTYVPLASSESEVSRSPPKQRVLDDTDEDENKVRSLVESAKFEKCIAIFVAVNALMQGLETECQYQTLFGNASFSNFNTALDAIEYIFCAVFVIEVSLRLYSYRCEFFTAKWNLFDMTIVCLQVLERVLHTVSVRLHMKVSAITLLRIARIIRISRMVRLVRTFEQLQTITSSIMLSINSLFWTLLLLFMLTYTISVLFAQTVIGMDEMPDAEIFAKIQYWFGGIPRTMLTMFEVITGGVSWDEVMHPIIKDISPVMGCVLLAYITFCLFAMLNIVTGVFVETALRKAREDTDTYTANHICDLFFNDEATDDEISWETFKKKLDSADMQEYFRSINVDPSEAHSLFRLLDLNDNEMLDASELVNGCLRLRGEAKALELSLLQNETSRMNKEVLAFHSRVLTFQSRAEVMLKDIADLLSNLAREYGGDNRLSRYTNGSVSILKE